ncbi:ANTAR domain-containing response regulator [Acetobacterium bakii]|uniref:Stage 0 sporulation protein A homolog n=1 Tax=Acetobacterium bakii TaxID=52689 RepID=A0A0L6U1V0_9FIRM|nr:response regulator [Acetobacterium bakii]KNZ42486.1 Fis family transcriptional regulator [Acetobacterium bakii]
MRIIVVEDEPVTRMDIRFILEDAGFEVLGEGKDGFDAINLCRSHHPDMVLMDINMPNLDGISAAKIIRRDKLCKCVVFLTAYSDDIFIEGAKKSGAFGYVVKPIDEKNLVPALKISYAKALEAEKTEQKLDDVTKRLEERKIIEKAKGFLMQSEGLDEDSAYKKIRTLSMEKGCSLRVISEMMLLQAQKGEKK